MNELSQKRFVQGTRLLAVLIAGGLLTACQTRAEKHDEFSRKSTFIIEDRYPIKVERGEVRLKIPTRRGARFSSAREHEVKKFLDDYRNAGTGRLVISTPHGGGGRANAVAGKIARLASEAGVPSSAVRYRHHGGSHHAPVIIAYRRHFAVTKKCGNWPDSLARAYENEPYHNFGCAHQHNIAAMAANPRDLVTPRSMGSPNASRLDDVFDKHRSGKSTTSTRSGAESGSVSSVQ